MRTFVAFVSAVILSATALAIPAAKKGPFTLSSPDFKKGETIPEKNVFNGMGCTGQNVSPALEWKNAPEGTKSLALFVHDPDAPTGSGWWHWVVYNIPANTTSLAADAGKDGGNNLPKGAMMGKTDFGSASYGGPCPPPGSGTHHYNFTLYALKVDKLEVPADASAAYVSFNANANALAKAKLQGTYSRAK